MKETTNNAMPDVANNIKALLSARGMTQRELSERLGIQYQQLYTTIHGNMTLETLRRLAETIGCTMGELIEPPTMTCPHCGKPIRVTLH